MSANIAELQAALEACFAEQVSFTAFWHEAGPGMPACSGEPRPDNLRDLILAQHYFNFALWHIEDEARRTDVDDSVIADCKRRIDALNQKRNDAMEAVDMCLARVMQPLLPRNAAPRHNTETAGMAIDRLSILALKLYHMEEQTRRRDVTAEHVRACSEKLDILNRQRRELARAVLELISDYAEGTRVPVLYAQCKMYNDPGLNPSLYGNSPPDKNPPSSSDGKPGHCQLPTQEERAALFLLSHEEAMRALEKEDPAAVAVATEYILDYSEKVGALLKAGKDYLELLAPKPELPAIERIAMELVLETVEEALEGEDA